MKYQTKAERIKKYTMKDVRVWSAARNKLIRLQGKAQRESDEALKKINLLDNVIEEIRNSRKPRNKIVNSLDTITGGVRLRTTHENQLQILGI
jgi:thymidylate synthase